ncbi:MAG: ACP S-malonyltransferase [Gammaproteobacteria bacterium]|nr:ACP S-malonyltransferase [Gammaproteobacteria bacterium]
MTTAFVFPGQGSQSLGMMADLAAQFPVVTDTFAQASEALGYDLWNLVQNGPEEKLNETDKTQPAMLAAGVAAWRVWQEKGGAMPAFLAGHSLGEYTALVAGGAIAFADAVSLVADRGRFMQEAVPAGTGAMAAILGLEDAQVAEVCDAASQGEVLQPVNFNSPGQVVIAGTATAVQRAVPVATEKGAKRAIILPVSVPSHCDLMRPAAERLAVRLAGISIQAPSIPVLHNADVAAYSDADKIRDALVRQLYSPVRWVETVQWFEAKGVTTIVECGPGKVLAGLNKRIVRTMSAFPVLDVDSLNKALAG